MSQNRSAKVKQLWREKKEEQPTVETNETAENKAEGESIINEENCLKLFDPEHVALCEDEELVTKVFKAFGPRRKNRLPVFTEICKEGE